MGDDKINPTSKKGLAMLDASLSVFEGAKNKAKLTAKQFSLMADVKIKIKGVKQGIVSPDKLLESLNALNKELKTTFKSTE